jgi:glycosyltransferase involved in cell wall biosynthesis
VLLRRPALDAAGPLDRTLGDLAVALADWGNRCAALGLGHVLADDVLAAGAVGAPGADAKQALEVRWPHHRQHAETLAGTPTFARALRAAGRGLRPVSVTVDGRALSAVQTGTQVHALELAAALLRTERADVRVVVPPDLDEAARTALATHGGGARLLGYEEAAAGAAEATDVVHRPSQVFSPDDLLLLVPLGRRLVVTHQDLIAYRIPDYHAMPDAWERYRSVTRAALGAADHVVFFSAHALHDAVSEDLVDPAHASVVPIGVDHAAVAPAPAAPPPELTGDDRGHLLCLGSDLRHKHRVFALRLLQALLAEGWGGRLVLAGGHAPNGSSRDEEDRLMEEAPALAAAVTRLEAVSEAERRWLTENAAAVVYPSLYEGFGLIPFESASAGVPALFASQTSLADVLPSELAVLRPWDPRDSARAALPLLTDGTARRAHVDSVRAAAVELTWDRTAHALVDRYEELVSEPPREAVAGPRTRLRLLQQIEESQQIRRAEAARFEAYTAAIGPDGLSLVGPDGLLDPRDQRALLAIASRRGPRKLLFSALRGVYRLAHRAR